MATDATMHPAAPAHLPGVDHGARRDRPALGRLGNLPDHPLMGLGSIYFWLHSIPERISHGTASRSGALYSRINPLVVLGACAGAGTITEALRTILRS